MATSPTGPGWFDENAAIEWCRGFIDHHCIFRSPPGQALLTTRDGGRELWQFYFPIAAFNQRFAQTVGMLFWRRYAKQFRERPFQLCGCESGGVPVTCAIQQVAIAYGIPVNVFEAKKKPKDYGIKNWLEGVVAKDVPVVLVDDVIGGQHTLNRNAKRLTEFGLELVGAFAIASCKRQPPLELELGSRKIEVQALLGPQDFARTHDRYVAKYRRLPQFQGTVV